MLWYGGGAPIGPGRAGPSPAGPGPRVQSAGAPGRAGPRRAREGERAARPGADRDRAYRCPAAAAGRPAGEPRLRVEPRRAKSSPGGPSRAKATGRASRLILESLLTHSRLVERGAALNRKVFHVVFPQWSTSAGNLE